MVVKLKTKVYRIAGKLYWRMKQSLSNQDGIGTVEVVLLILVAVGLVLIFKDRITALVNSIFSKITSQAGKV